ncbi:MAG: protoheme IX farnesyltransferase [Prolixibacteraceae bacterium]|jgi:protoheme IX farnesyltransferase|nr:protoheme IX farnesyltransferase [Prolixibacteraceae bacterium]
MTEVKTHMISLNLKWKALLDLTKFKVSVAVALSAFAGFVLYSKEINLDIFIFSIGLMFIIGASSALNHIQERKLDILMPRTQKRPLPSKLLTLNEAIGICISFFALGSVILFFGFSFQVWLVSMFAAFWYNGIYTPLKRKTPYAIIPGSVVGAIPPFIGYMAAGGAISDKPIIILAVFFFIGQIPHFWLLMKKYRNDYQKAGFPVITEKMNESQINRMIVTWMAAGIAAGLLVSILVPFSRAASYILVAYCVFFLFVISKDLVKKIDLQFGKNFLLLNTMYLLVMLLIIVDFIL